MKKTSLLFVFAALLAACASPAIPTEPPAANVPQIVKAVPSLELPSKSTESPIPLTPTINLPTIPLATPTVLSTSTATSVPAPSPTPTPAAEEICASMAAQGQRGLYVLYVQPMQNLVWDQAPRTFTVGFCNSLPVPLVPESHFVVSIVIPWRRDGAGQTSATTAQLSPGFHELVLGPWIPGLENHLTICVQKAVVEVVIGYSDEYRSSNFRPLHYPDGKDRVLLPVECGGSYA